MSDFSYILCPSSLQAQEPFFSGTDLEMDQNEPYSFAVPIFGPGVVYDVPLEVRQQQLKFLRVALRSDVMKTYVSPIIFEAKNYFNQWGDSGGLLRILF